jgi:hypothetical protein
VFYNLSGATDLFPLNVSGTSAFQHRSEKLANKGLKLASIQHPKKKKH